MLFHRNWTSGVSRDLQNCLLLGLEFVPELLLVSFIFSLFLYFYRTMLSRARYCHSKSFVRLSVLLSVSDVEISWPAQCLEYFGNNFMAYITRVFSLCRPLTSWIYSRASSWNSRWNRAICGVVLLGLYLFSWFTDFFVLTMISFVWTEHPTHRSTSLTPITFAMLCYVVLFIVSHSHLLLCSECN